MGFYFTQDEKTYIWWSWRGVLSAIHGTAPAGAFGGTKRSRRLVNPLRGLKSIDNPETKNPTLNERRIILFGGVGGMLHQFHFLISTAQ